MSEKDLRRGLAAEIRPQDGTQKVEEMQSFWIVMMFDAGEMKCFLSFNFNEMEEALIVISTNVAV